MKVLDIIHVSCAILSASAEVAPLVKNYIATKKARKMAARKGFRQATVETDDEDEELRSTRKHVESGEEEEGL